MQVAVGEATSGTKETAGWSKLGFDGDPLPGDPRVLQSVVDDFTYLRDVAWSVSQGLEAVVASSLSGGFEGETADALREAISGQLKSFVYNVARAFSLAGEAVAEYRSALVAAQQVVADAAGKAGGPVAGTAAGDGQLAGLKRQVTEQQAAVADAVRTMEAALRDAAEMVSQPIKVPSLWVRIRAKFEFALAIVGGVLAFASMFFGTAPVGFALGAAAFAAAGVSFGLTADDVAHHRAKWTALLWAASGFVGPWARGIFSLAALGAGAQA